MATGLVTIGSAASSSMRKPCSVSKLSGAWAGATGGTEGNCSGAALVAAAGRRMASAVRRSSAQEALRVALRNGIELDIGEVGFPEFEFRGFEIEDGRVGAEAELRHGKFLEHRFD